MIHLDSVLVEKTNPRWAYHEAGVCNELELRHEEVLTEGGRVYRLGCLFVVDDTLVGHVKYHKATTFISWVNASTQGESLVQGSAYYIDNLLFNKVHPLKSERLTPPRPCVYEWDVLELEQARFRFIRDFVVDNSARKKSLIDLIALELSSQDLPYSSSSRMMSFSSNSP